MDEEYAENLRWLLRRSEEIVMHMNYDLAAGPKQYEREKDHVYEERKKLFLKTKTNMRDYAAYWREWIKKEIKRFSLAFFFLAIMASPVSAELICPKGTQKKCFCIPKIKTPTPLPVVCPTMAPSPTAVVCPTAPPSLTPTTTPSVAPTFSNATIPQFSKWQDNMKSYGLKHCTLLKGSASYDEKLAATYYDLARILYQIYDDTLDTNLLACADAAEKIYRDKYAIGANGGVPGYWSFTKGLVIDYLRNNDAISKSAVNLIALNGAYHPDSTPLAWTQDSTMSREVAYAIEAYLDAEDVGYPRRVPRLQQMIDQAFGHYDQWFVKKTAPYVRPFMMALTAEALIQANEKIPNVKTLPAIKLGADWIWDNCWIPGSKAFKYTDRPTDSGGTEPAPDLNLLIAPVYAWLYMKTGDIKYRDRHDLIFEGGVLGSYLTQPKIYNQNYRWSFDGVKWRGK